MTTDTQQTFANRIGFGITCVIPADVLSADALDEQDRSNLRADASQGELSYTRVKRALEEGIYLASVAASPERAANGYTVLLREQQLYAALPWDQRLQGQPADRILAQLRAHAAEVQPLGQQIPAPKRGTPTLSTMPLTPLETVEVTTEEIQEILALVAKQGKGATESRGLKLFHVQQALLSAMVDALMTQLYQAQERTQALIIKARCALLAQIQRWHRCMHQDAWSMQSHGFLQNGNRWCGDSRLVYLLRLPGPPDPTRCATRSEEVASQQEILELPRLGMSPQMGNLTHDTQRSPQLS